MKLGGKYLIWNSQICKPLNYLKSCDFLYFYTCQYVSVYIGVDMLSILQITKEVHKLYYKLKYEHVNNYFS